MVMRRPWRAAHHLEEFAWRVASAHRHHPPLHVDLGLPRLRLRAGRGEGRQEARRDPGVHRLLEVVRVADQLRLVPALADELHADRQRPNRARGHRDGRPAGDRGGGRRAHEDREVVPVDGIRQPRWSVGRRDDRIEVVRFHRVA